MLPWLQSSMTGRTLDACRYLPRNLWQHLDERLGIEPPDLGQTGSQWLALQDLKRWLYEHGILLQRDRSLRQLIVQVAREVETTLTGELTQAFAHNVMVQLVGAVRKNLDCRRRLTCDTR